MCKILQSSAFFLVGKWFAMPSITRSDNGNGIPTRPIRNDSCVTVISALVPCGGVPVEDGMREAVPGGKNSNTESLAAVRAESVTWYVSSSLSGTESLWLDSGTMVIGHEHDDYSDK